MEALKLRLESDKVWAWNETEKLRVKKEQALALTGMHVEQAVSRIVRYTTGWANIVRRFFTRYSSALSICGSVAEWIGRWTCDQ